MQWRFRASVFVKTFVSTNLVSENHGKNILSASEMINLFISEKIVEDMCTGLSNKTKAVFSHSSDKQKRERMLHSKNCIYLEGFS
jgi:hypothetical protein